MSLVNSTDEILNSIDIAKSFNFAKLAPYIKEAEEDFLIPVLSQTQFDDLQSKYDALPGTPLVPPYDRLLELAQTAVIYYGCMLYAPHHRITASNAGIMQNRGQHTVPSTQWEHRDWINSLQSTADKTIEKLLDHLEANKATFTLWANSDAFTESKDTFINNAKEFSRYQTIDSRTTFIKLLPFMRTVESMFIKRLICTDTYDLLKVEYSTDSLSTANENLLDELRPIIATKTLLKAADRLNTEITNKGIRLVTSDNGIDKKSMPNTMQLKSFKYDLKKEYEMREEDLKLFLEKNISDYPLYEASDCYTSKADPGPTHVPTNDETKKTFRV